MAFHIDFAPQPPKDAPKSEHREYNKMVRKAYKDAKKDEKRFFKLNLKEAELGNETAILIVAQYYEAIGNTKKQRYWFDKVYKTTDRDTHL